MDSQDKADFEQYRPPSASTPTIARRLLHVTGSERKISTPREISEAVSSDGQGPNSYGLTGNTVLMMYSSDPTSTQQQQVPRYSQPSGVPSPPLSTSSGISGAGLGVGFPPDLEYLETQPTRPRGPSDRKIQPQVTQNQNYPKKELQPGNSPATKYGLAPSAEVQTVLPSKQSTQNFDPALDTEPQGSGWNSDDDSDVDLDILGPEMSTDRFRFHIKGWEDALEKKDWDLVEEHAQVLEKNKLVEVEKSKDIAASSPLITALACGEVPSVLESITTLQQTNAYQFPSFNLIKTVTLIRTGDFNAARRACNRLIKQMRDGGEALGLAFQLMAEILKATGKNADAQWYRSQSAIIKTSQDSVNKLQRASNSEIPYRIPLIWVAAVLAIPDLSEPQQPDEKDTLSSDQGPRNKATTLREVKVENYGINLNGSWATEHNHILEYMTAALSKSPEYTDVDLRLLPLLGTNYPIGIRDVRPGIIYRAAIAVGHPDVVVVIEKVRDSASGNGAAGVKINEIGPGGYPPLIAAVLRENRPAVDELLKWPDMNIHQKYDDRTAIQLACANNSKGDVVRALIAGGASLYALAEDGTPSDQRYLHTINQALLNPHVNYGNFDIAEALINAGVDVGWVLPSGAPEFSSTGKDGIEALREKVAGYW
ncbi:hypothetical protein ABW19_dt0204384 [Dactylella cylindrospora]|nr:hypothetical protein ABW19_dt0204384 [Dactylella cylindrospora]